MTTTARSLREYLEALVPHWTIINVAAKEITIDVDDKRFTVVVSRYGCSHCVLRSGLRTTVVRKTTKHKARGIIRLVVFEMNQVPI